MTLPAQPTDVWTKATQHDIVVALTRLSTLPSRAIEPGTEDIARDAMYRGLSGVTRYGLSEAIDAVLQNKLGHGFFPSPPELRGLCDKAMEHHARMRERIALRQQAERERPSEKVPLTDAEKRRQQERMRAFHAALDTGELESALEAVVRAEIRARYGMTDEALAGMRDKPLDGNWKRTA